MKRYIIFVSCILLSLSFSLSAQWTDNINDYFNKTAPSVGMSFLKIGMGARAISLAGTYSSIVRDPTAVYWNPAGVIYSEGIDVSFSHLSLMEDIYYEFVALSTGDTRQGVGLGMGGVFYGGMELRGNTPSEEPIGTFSAYSFLIKFAYARRLGNDFVLGGSIGGILERIYIYSTHTYTLDVGLLYYLPVFKPLVFSLNVNNLGPKVVYIDDSFRLPLTGKIGGSYTMQRGKATVMLATDVSKSIDSPLSSGFGIETGYSFLKVRLGYRYNEKNIRRWTAGFGVQYKFLSIDYSLSPYLMDMGKKHCISLNFDG